MKNFKKRIPKILNSKLMEWDELHQYKIAIIASFPPLPGGMAQLAVRKAILGKIVFEGRFR